MSRLVHCATASANLLLARFLRERLAASQLLSAALAEVRRISKISPRALAQQRRPGCAPPPPSVHPPKQIQPPDMCQLKRRRPNNYSFFISVFLFHPALFHPPLWPPDVGSITRLFAHRGISRQTN